VRLRQIRYEKALLSLVSRSYPAVNASLSSGDALVPDDGMHCGLRIQTHCHHCDHHHSAFYPICSACGTPRNGAKRGRSPARLLQLPPSEQHGAQQAPQVTGAFQRSSTGSPAPCQAR
jgi:hypothetical protein